MIARGLISRYHRVIVVWGGGVDGMQGGTETTDVCLAGGA